MCGIAGFSGKFSDSLLRRMSRVLAHRGPDAEGRLYMPEKQLGLVHRRLSIIDLSPAGTEKGTDLFLSFMLRVCWSRYSVCQGQHE